MAKKIVIVGIVLLVLVGIFGCSSKDKKEGRREPIVAEKETKGTDDPKQLDLDQTLEKIDDKESLIFMMTKSTCSHCNSFKKTLVPFLKEYMGILFYELEADILGEMKSDVEKNPAKLQKKIPEFGGGTPEVFCYEKGKLKKTVSGEISEAALYNFMIDYGYIRGEKKEKKVEDYNFQTSKRIKNQNLIEITKKVDNKDTFYLTIAQSNRYDQALTKKLIPALEDKKIDVATLHFPLERKGADDEMNKIYETLMNCVKDLSASPAVFKVTKGKAEKLLEDNTSVGDVEKALQKQSG